MRLFSLVVLIVLAGVRLGADQLERRTWLVNGVPREALVRVPDKISAGGAPLVLFDVGLGAAANALAALRCARAAPAGARRLLVFSFERDLGALALAASADGAARLQWSAADRAAALELLEHGVCDEARFRWQLVAGCVLDALARVPQPADLVFWDPWSPRSNGELWTARAFTTLRAHCAPGAELFTYSRATAVRSALLLAYGPLSASLPLPPLGRLGLDPATMLVWPAVLGTGTDRQTVVDVPIPDLPLLQGLPLFAQALVVEQGGRARLSNVWREAAIE